MQNKPIIRHCKNCEYCDNFGGEYGGSGCLITYKFNFSQRLKALFCRYYKAKGGVDNG